MRRWHRETLARVHDERGVALIVALAFLLLLTLGFATSIALTASGARHSFKSRADQQAYSLAEDGVNEAAAVIFADANVALAASIDCNNPTTYTTVQPGYTVAYADLLAPRTTVREEGEVTWSGTFVCPTSGDDPYWQVTSVATVTNPTGPGAGDVSRTVTAKIPLTDDPQPVITTIPVGNPVTDTYTYTNTITETVPGWTTTTVTTYKYESTWSGGSFIYSFGDIELGGGSSTEQAIIAEGNLEMGGASGYIAASAGVVSVRGYIDPSGGYSIGMNPTTVLTTSITATSTTIPVNSTAAFPASGLIKIQKEYITYSSKTATSFTASGRGALGTTPASHATSDGTVSGGPPPTLTAPLSASATIAPVTWVPNTNTNFNPAGLRPEPPSTDIYSGMFSIPNSTGGSEEFIKYTGVGTTAAACGGLAPPCFTGLLRGYVPGYPAAEHDTGAPVDPRIKRIITKGGCAKSSGDSTTNCGGMHSINPIESGPAAQLIQDDPSFKLPTFDIVTAKRDAAPGPNHLPPATNGAGIPDCTIRANFVGTSSYQFYAGGSEIDLTPTASYTCKGSGGGYAAPAGADYADGTGELSWNATTKVLKIRGVVYLPAPVKMTQGARYDAPAAFGGGAVIYVEGGRFRPAGNLLCGKAIVVVGGEPTCDQTWNPNIHNNLAIVGVNLPAGISNPVHDFIFSSGTFFQGLVYTDGFIDATGGAVVSGTLFGHGVAYGGGGVAPAPGTFQVPTGFGSPVPVTSTVNIPTDVVTTHETTTLSTSTSIVMTETTVTSSSTVQRPAPPQDFGG